MSTVDIRTLTTMGEKLLHDHSGNFRKELLERFSKIAEKVSSFENLTPEQKSVVQTFLLTGRTIAEKAAVSF